MYFEKNYTARNYSQNNFLFFQKFQEVNKTVLAHAVFALNCSKRSTTKGSNC